MDIGKIEQINTGNFTGSGWTCPNCGSQVYTTGHACTLTAGSVSKSYSTGHDEMILTELQAIRALLEKLVAKSDVNIEVGE